MAKDNSAFQQSHDDDPIDEHQVRDQQLSYRQLDQSEWDELMLADEPLDRDHLPEDDDDQEDDEEDDDDEHGDATSAATKSVKYVKIDKDDHQKIGHMAEHEQNTADENDHHHHGDDEDDDEEDEDEEHGHDHLVEDVDDDDDESWSSDSSSPSPASHDDDDEDDEGDDDHDSDDEGTGFLHAASGLDSYR